MADTARPRIHVIATQHLDVAYLWRRSPDGEELMRSCFERALAMLDADPTGSFVFSRSTAWSFAVLEREDPRLFERVRAQVKAGRIELCGGQWVEPDTVIASGELLVRECLYGQRWFLSRFGSLARAGWNPDVFGHAASVPQILRGSGMRGYYFHRCIPVDARGREIEQFRWKGPDGAETLVYGGNWRGTPDRRVLEACLAHLEGARRSTFVATGANSDRRVTMEPEWLEAFDAAREKLRTERPEVEIGWSTASAMLEDMERDRASLPVVEGEIGFQFTGTYTSEGRIKRAARRVEAELLDAEKLASAAWLQGAPYPAEALGDAWRDLCVNGFHDIICGTCYAHVHEEALELYRDIESRATVVRDRALAALVDEEPGFLTVANTLSFPRGGAIEAAGHVFVVPEVPAHGFLSLDLGHIEAPERPVRIDLAPSGVVLENECLRVVLDPANGEIRSLYSKTAGRETLAEEGRGNRLVFYGDRTPLSSYEPWYIHFTGEVLATEIVDMPAVVESGPARAAVAWTVRPSRPGQSTRTRIEQLLLLCAGSPYLELRCRGDWQEENVLLEAETDLAFSCSTVAAEMPYGTAERLPRRDGAHADAEVRADSALEDGLDLGSRIAEPDLPMHRWLDLSDGERGLAILNDGIHGYDASPLRVRLSLMRAPRHRDGKIVGLGPFSFGYAFLPHAGAWRDAALPRQGLSYNHPLLVTRGRASGEALVTVDRPNVLATAIKRAEDGAGLVLRLYESHGTATRVAVRTSFPVGEARASNLIEEPDATAGAVRQVSEREIEVVLGPYEIRTLRLVPSIASTGPRRP